MIAQAGSRLHQHPKLFRTSREITTAHASTRLYPAPIGILVLVLPSVVWISIMIGILSLLIDYLRQAYMEGDTGSVSCMKMIIVISFANGLT